MNGRYQRLRVKYQSERGAIIPLSSCRLRHSRDNERCARSGIDELETNPLYAASFFIRLVSATIDGRAHRRTLETQSKWIAKQAAAMHTPAQISLKRRVLNAGIWSLAGYGCNQVLRFGSNLLMTRLLVPEMFGVMAIASVVMTGLAMFSDLGLKPSVVQSRRGNDPNISEHCLGDPNSSRATSMVLSAHRQSADILANRIGMTPTSSVYADPSLPFVIAALVDHGRYRRF